MQPPNLDAPVMLGAPNPAMTTQVNWPSGVLTVPDMREDLCALWRAREKTSDQCIRLKWTFYAKLHSEISPAGTLTPAK